jgi:hypothetical protein
VPSLPELEASLDERLPVDRLRGRAPASLIDAARAWSDVVWETAAADGPATLAPRDRESGLALAHRPVFICGAHRSGTTLVRDLLDDHPALSVLPAEGTYHTNLAPALTRRPPGDWLRLVAREWVRRLANPINRPPYWLLGRGTATTSPYVAFVRTLSAWWPEIHARLGQTHPSWPLVAVALAYAHTTGRLRDRGLARWVEKTPANERFLEPLEAEFPAAVCIHVVRHPFATLASRKQLEVDATGRFRDFTRALDDLAVSFRVATTRHADGPRYCRIRYEDLIDDPTHTTERIARAIGIAWTSVLLVPTVNGRAASSNTAVAAFAERGVIMPASDRTNGLTAREQSRVVHVLGDLAPALGYDLPPVRGFGRLLRRPRRQRA